MEANFTLFVVDDDPTMRTLFSTMFSDRYEIELFESGAACLQRMGARTPNLCVLDIGLTGIDGYELCRRIKGRPATAAVPVIFISAYDDLDSRLASYDAGAEEYVVKPFDVADVYHKIENVRRIAQERGSLSAQVAASDQLASLVLANLDAYAILIRFLRTLNECAGYREVADTVLHVLEVFHLEGAVQIRLRDFETTLSKSGENWPLELSVIKHVRTLERIFEFGMRAAYNFEHLTVLVTNMPIADPELCGRIRDNIAIAAESADAKLQALQAFDDNARTRAELAKLLAAVQDTIRSYGHRYDEARYSGALYTKQFLDDMLASFAHLGMSQQQEEQILDLVRTRSNGLIDLYDIGGESQATLHTLSERFETLLAATGNAKAVAGKS